MYDMEQARSSIERFALAASSALRLEIAIFDHQNRLFFCTPTYLKKKGKLVHAPSIQEVLDNGSVLVNQPGEMPSCMGCRFKHHCPSTIEVLCCIRIGTEVLGVVSLTSFHKEGERRIIENTSVYLNAVTELGNLISSALQAASGNRGSTSHDILLQSALEISSSPMLMADAHGVILRYNQRAAKLIASCGGSASSLWQMFPVKVVQKLLRGAAFFERPVPIDQSMIQITSHAVMADDKLAAVFLRFSDEVPLPSENKSALDRIVGDSPQMMEVRRMIRQLADSPTPVLITGETGTGKELVARAIHGQSKRRKYPFVAINCSSIPESLFESELFGYEEGSFTGAKKGGKMGKIELAQGGVLFLDELGEMPMSIQPKFLRVLQEYELSRVGSTETIRLNIRIIAATNRNLRDLIQEGRFREDLYYRINVINLALPPLRQHREDIMPITHNYLEQLRTKLEMPLKTISPEAQAVLMEYDWPGNVRELQNAVEYAANLCSEEVLTPKDLPGHLAAAHSADTPREPPEESSEEQLLRELLIRYGYTLEGKKLIAAHMGISLRTLYRRLERFHI